MKSYLASSIYIQLLFTVDKQKYSNTQKLYTVQHNHLYPELD